MQICPLASGSSGNCTFIESGDTKILIDAGISTRRIGRSLAKIGVNPRELDALLITHEHGDHCRETSRISTAFRIPVYMNQKTYEICRCFLNGKEEMRYFNIGKSLHIKDLFVFPFPLFHDAQAPVGFRIQDENTSLGMAVDLGVVTDQVIKNLKDCETVILESNHDLDMLINGDYPWHLKQRIRSQVGHLSNRDAGKTLKELFGGGRLRKVYLAHLSQNNNRPEVALNTVKSRLENLGPEDLEIMLTWHHKMSKCIKI